MHEGGRALLVRLRQRRPGLYAEQPRTLAALLRRRALGMDDAAAGRHQVQLAGADRQRRAEAVAVHDLAVEQVGDGGKPDVRVRAHVDAGADQELGRSHLVEEDEGADHLPAHRGQRTAHREAAEVAGARHDDLLDGIARVPVAGDRVVGR